MARLENLLARTEDAISQLEAQNKSGDEPSPPCLPAELQQAQVLQERIQHAMSCLARDHSTFLNESRFLSGELGMQILAARVQDRLTRLNSTAVPSAQYPDGLSQR